MEETTSMLGSKVWISFGEMAMGRGHSVRHKLKMGKVQSRYRDSEKTQRAWNGLVSRTNRR